MAATKKTASSKIITIEDSSGTVYRINLEDCYLCNCAIINKYTDRRIVIVPVDQIEDVIEVFNP